MQQTVTVKLERIVELKVAEVGSRLAERGVSLALTEAAKAALVAEGYDPAYGARPLRRVIQRQVENAVSKRLLAGEIAEGDTVTVDHTADGYTFGKAAGAVAEAA